MRIPNALTGGRWVPRNGIVVWVPSHAPTPLEVARMKAARRRQRPTPTNSPDLSISAACSYYGIDPADIERGRREQPYLAARRTAMWLMRQDGYSYPRIGAVLHRDHTTVIDNIRAMEADQPLLDVGRQIRAALTGEAAA